jgi:hypothetical protein
MELQSAAPLLLIDVVMLFAQDCGRKIVLRCSCSDTVQLVWVGEEEVVASLQPAITPVRTVPARSYNLGTRFCSYEASDISKIYIGDHRTSRHPLPASSGAVYDLHGLAPHQRCLSISACAGVLPSPIPRHHPDHNRFPHCTLVHNRTGTIDQTRNANIVLSPVCIKTTCCTCKRLSTLAIMVGKPFLAALLTPVHVLGRKEPDEDNNLRTASPCCDPKTFSHFNADLPAKVAVTSLTARLQTNYSAVDRAGQLPFDADISFCQVKVYLTHEGSDDRSLVEVWLPPQKEAWNGRFQATGGAGFSTGIFDAYLGPALEQGYAAASTDGGHDGTRLDDLSWALKADGTVDWNLLHNFATRSIAEQIVVGKSVTERYYGQKPHHSYWNGCSQGGRQGYAIAQKYPKLLDGILADAPGIGMTHFAMGNLWPHLVMKEAGLWMSHCELDFFHQKAMEDCDMLDGVSDGIISDPDVCDFDPLHIIGMTFYCDAREGQVTQAMAEIVRRIEEGPRTAFGRKIWHGLPVGTRKNYLASTTTSPGGVRLPIPFPISSNFIQTLLLKDPSFNVTRISHEEYMALWAQASYEYSWLLDADEPDLTSFKEAGSKLLTWHGINDPVIPYYNTVQYRQRVESIMGGAQNVDSFYRLFLAPGVEHCSGGAGPVPRDPLGALVDWVENNLVPETLEASTINAEGDLVSRDLCAWPGKLKYMGISDYKRASSWTCVGGTERSEVEFEQDEIAYGRAGIILGGLKDKLEGLGLGLRIG